MEDQHKEVQGDSTATADPVDAIQNPARIRHKNLQKFPSTVRNFFSNPGRRFVRLMLDKDKELTADDKKKKMEEWEEKRASLDGQHVTDLRNTEYEFSGVGTLTRIVQKQSKETKRRERLKLQREERQRLHMAAKRRKAARKEVAA